MKEAIREFYILSIKNFVFKKPLSDFFDKTFHIKKTRFRKRLHSSRPRLTKRNPTKNEININERHCLSSASVSVYSFLTSFLSSAFVLS